jgi:hypothetical protein
VYQHTLERTQPKSFKGLSEAIDSVVCGKNKHLHHEIRQAGLQAFLDTRRVGSVQVLNTIGNPRGIQLSDLFQAINTLYISLPSAGNHALSGMIGRLILGSLFDAAAFVKRIVPVLVIIDEWQKLVAGGLLETLLTQARSCGVALILVNQTLEDLVTKEKDFRPTMKACCRCHWQFGEANPQRQVELSEQGGTYEDVEVVSTMGLTGPHIVK